MAQEIWLHIGLPKCGSTSVQRYFARHDRANLHQGLCYPAAFRSTVGYMSHRPLAQCAPADLTAALTEIAAEAAGCDRILLSCEAWGKAVSEGNLLALIEAAGVVMPERRLRIVAYFRNVYGFVESSYAQFVKAGLFGIPKKKFFRGDSIGLERFLQMFEARRGFMLYSNLGHARDMLAHLPRDALSLRSIEAVDLLKADMVQDLCGLLRVPFRGTLRSLNRRMSDRKLAEFEYLQTVVDQDTFARMRRDLMKLELASGTEPGRFHSADMHIGPERHQRMLDTLARERADLAALFDTGVAGLCEDRWGLCERHDRLSDADRAGLTDFAAGY